jgi:hypothetical protein
MTTDTGPAGMTTAAAVKLGGPILPMASLEKPNVSVGTPSRLVSSFLLPFSSWKKARA